MEAIRSAGGKAQKRTVRLRRRREKSLTDNDDDDGGGAAVPTTGGEFKILSHIHKYLFR